MPSLSLDPDEPPPIGGPDTRPTAAGPSTHGPGPTPGALRARLQSAQALWARLVASPRTRPLVVWSLFLVGALAAYHALLTPYGGRFYDGDFATPTTFPDLRYYLEEFSGPWNPGSIVFGFNPFFTNDLVLLSVVGAFSVLLGSLGTGMLAVMLLVQAALGFSLYVSSRRLGVDPRWAVVAGVASAASPVVFDRTTAGHELVLAAAIFVPPFLVLLGEVTSRPVSARVVVVLGLLWGVIGLLEYHVFYMVGIVWAVGFVTVLLRIIPYPRTTSFRERLAAGAPRARDLVLALLVAVGVNLVWLIPAETAGAGSSAANTSTATVLGILNYTQGAIKPTTVFASNIYWGQLYTMAWGSYHGFSIGLLVSSLLSILFVGVLFWTATHRSRPSDTLLLVAIVMVVLSTAAVVPGGLYLFLVHTVPFFAVNDDPAKFDVILTPCLCLLLGRALQAWSVRFPVRPTGTLDRRAPRWRRLERRFGRVVVPAAVLMVVITALPFASGNFNRQVSHVADAPGALPAANALDATVPPLGRVALFPPDPSQYVGRGQPPTNPLATYPPGSAIYIPALPGTEPLNLATRAAIWSYVSLYTNSTSHAGNLFGLLDTTSFDVDRAAPQSPLGGLYEFDSPGALRSALAAQVDLGPSVSYGPTRIYSVGNGTAGPLTLQGPAVLALADREFLLDAAYLPNGDAWVGSTPFVLDPGTLAGPNAAANSTAPYVETPEGVLDAVFANLPTGSVVPVEPIVWSTIENGGLESPGDWTPWEKHYDLEAGRPLAALVGYGATNNGLQPLTVPLPRTGGAGSEVWVDLFYGSSEGSVQATIGSQPPTTLDGYAPFPDGFHWTRVGALGNASSVSFVHVGAGWSTIAEVAVVPPGGLSTAVNATRAWLASNGAGPGQAPILWVKGDEGLGSGTWTPVATGANDSQGWGSVVNPDGAFTTTFLLPEAATVGVLARASGTGSLYVSACPDTSVTDRSFEPCPEHALVSFDQNASTWEAGTSNLTVGPGVVRVTVYGATQSVLLDQLVLTPDPASLLGPCAGGASTDWLCGGSAEAPSSVTGNVGGPTVSATFAPLARPSVLVHLVTCDAPWSAQGSGLGSVPFLVDGWACGYLARAGVTHVEVDLPTVIAATQVGFVASVVVAVPAVGVLAIGGPRIRRFLRRRRTEPESAPDGAR
ncbi:MAG: hypothetical protein L3K16_01605 [Thermoplasmata archaeon]|nr:hypothetical protein [Thermoplasmata archaeon]